MTSMRCDKRPRDEAVEMVNDPPKFMITDKTPPLLMAWWNNMHEFRQTEIFKHFGFLTDIMRFSPDRDLIEALIPFWDFTSNVFRFSDFELTPTLEELGGFTGLGKDLRSKTLIAPRSVSGNKFLEQMHIIHPHKECFDNGLVSLEFLYSRYGKKEVFSDYEKQLKNGQHLPTWEKHRQEAFMVAFLGTMVFPRRDKKISIRLSGIVAVMMKKKKSTILPMMLADIYRALTKCREEEDFFEGCSILLQMWFLEHLYRHRFAIAFKYEWTNYILSHPDRMKELVDKLPKGVKAWRHYLLKLTASDITWNYHWFPASEVIVMSSYRPFFVLTGLRGFQPYIPLRVLRQLGQKQILPRAEDTQSFLWEVSSEDRDRDRESEAQKLCNDLKNAREELAQRDAIFKERVRLIQKKAEKEHQSTIRTLHEDLGIVTGAMEQQNEEYKKEKILLMHTHARLQNQLKALMGRETDIAKQLQAYEEDLTHTIGTAQEWLQNCHENMEEAKGQVLQLTESLIDVYGGYLHRSDESLGRLARALVPHLPKALFKVYSSLGGN
ncbi:hypothetical protein KY290_033848 [Solanum tuberosum]|uniref:DUF7745 domain-containing protein n=1 Tax=Solanum tuberosum TaxID=4113 RepID=A0ABQ7U210_SOLTU|nr:hypothetical protein KY285_033109 [Solanum tuberosum]KAH0740805.1 hypothetical protein KY290_033848 [Solanum tuberosum]